MIDRGQPFVLLDDMRDGGEARSRLYTRPVEIVSATWPGEVAPALERLRAARAEGLHAAGYIGYEAGHALEPRLTGLARAARPGDPPLLWFGLFEGCDTAGDVAALLPDPAGAHVGRPAPRVSRRTYEATVATVLGYIAAGDIYQANLSFRADVPVFGDPLALYARVRRTSRAGWGGVIFTGTHWLLSCSPELFFALEDGRLTARPMKGTARRAGDGADDAAVAAALVADPKQRAENLMIVDLLRNDLSRVAVPGSVAVPHLFTLETYPTVHTMTSTVTADIAEGCDAIDVIRAIFPCGSITGAPKIRAMEIIDMVEGDARGPYCGSIGWLDPDGRAGFNVAIRTLVLEERSGDAVIGLGSAIVADSDAGDEWRECHAKAAFLNAGVPGFDLIETMRFDAVEGIVDLERHLERMKRSADILGFAFDRHDVRNELQAATFRLREDRRIRLRLSPSGAVAIEAMPAPVAQPGPVDVAIVPLPVLAADVRLRHKTSARGFYDDARRAAGTFEVVFADRDGFLTEGSFTSLFVERDGRLLTPPLARGLLPGVLRQRLIEEGRAIEADLRAGDLAGGFLIGNALRGLIAARVA
jgi:para-aminobenzoate synthetase/4-amino-4-deoxychorismate lyase